jgi:hypothetical protein
MSPMLGLAGFRRGGKSCSLKVPHISLWARAIAKILAMVFGQIGTYCFLVLFLVPPNPHLCK